MLLFNTGRTIAAEAAAESHAAYADFVLGELKRLGVPLPDPPEAVMRGPAHGPRTSARIARPFRLPRPATLKRSWPMPRFSIDSHTRLDVDLAAPVDTMLAKFSKQRHMFVAKSKLGA